MARDETKFHFTYLEHAFFKEEVTKFLVTHKDGITQLVQWMQSVPADRTREEYYAQLAKDDAMYRAIQAETLVRVNRERAELGLGPIEFRNAREIE
jgi:hypothetical protein